MYLLIENIYQTKGFKLINWNQLVELILNPPIISATSALEAKRQSLAVTASNCLNKRLEAITEHNNFTLLRLDLDETQHTLETIRETLHSLDVSSYIIHTTASHQQAGKGSRYRIYLELADGVAHDEWQLAQIYLAYCFGADDCSNRPQQIMFLPVRYAGGQYFSYVNNGEPLKLSKSRLFEQAISFDDDQKKKIQMVEKEQASLIKPPYAGKRFTGQISIIDAVNVGYVWSDLLTQYGYKRQGRAWLPPESKSRCAGVYILAAMDGKERYYSHHTSDPCSTGGCIDKFDFLVIRSFGGDVCKAIRSLSKHFPDIDVHNRKIYWAQKTALMLETFRGGYQ